MSSDITNSCAGSAWSKQNYSANNKFEEFRPMPVSSCFPLSLFTCVFGGRLKKENRYKHLLSYAGLNHLFSSSFVFIRVVVHSTRKPSRIQIDHLYLRIPEVLESCLICVNKVALRLQPLRFPAASSRTTSAVFPPRKFVGNLLTAERTTYFQQ